MKKQIILIKFSKKDRIIYENLVKFTKFLQ